MLWWNIDAIFAKVGLWELLRLYNSCKNCLLSDLYSGTESAVNRGGGVFSLFPVNAGVRQGCILAPLLFNTHMDCILGRAVDQSCGAFVGNSKVIDPDFADDTVSLLSLWIFLC